MSLMSLMSFIEFNFLDEEAEEFQADGVKVWLM